MPSADPPRSTRPRFARRGETTSAPARLLQNFLFHVPRFIVTLVCCCAALAPVPIAAQTEPDYERAPIHYSATTPNDAVTRLQARLKNGTVKLIFQPGEELSPGGASILIREGVLQNPRPEVIFGQHVNPDAPCGTAAFVSGTMMAATDELYWTIHGKSGHAAQPHHA